jgi:hypothetical protein
VIFIDEIAIFVSNILIGEEKKITPERLKQTNELMHWIRQNSLKYKDRIRFILTGSIGLEPVLRQAGLSGSVNNFHSFEITPWDDQTSIKCLRALSQYCDIEFEPGAMELMVKKLGLGIPGHLQIFFDAIRERCDLRGINKISEKDISEIYTRKMLSVKGHAELCHYEERLDLVMGKTLFPLPLELLTEAAVVGRLKTEATDIILKCYEFKDRKPDEALREVLEILVHDGYLHIKNKDYVFMSKWLKDWWKSRHKEHYSPAAKRRS